MNRPPVILFVRRDDKFSAILREGGCEVINLELVKTEPVGDLAELKSRLARIDQYDGLFFTSPAAARVFADEAASAKQNFGAKIYVLGERVRDVLEGAGFEAVCREDANTAEELIASFDEAEFSGKRLLFVRGNKSMQTIPTMLAGVAEIDEVVVYKTEEVRPDERTLQFLKNRFEDGEIDWICFFSPSGVEAFLKNFPAESVSNTCVAVIGSTTARFAEKVGLRVKYVSGRATADDFAAGLLGKLQFRPATSLKG